MDADQVRFSAIQKLFPTIHLELMKGTKQQALDYIQKQGKYADSNGKVSYVARRGDMKDNQGQRTDIMKDMELIPVLIEQGLSPEQIMDIRFSLRRYSKIIREAYYRKRYKETDEYREVFVRWHFGEPGSGKTRQYPMLCKQHQRENVYFVNQYRNPFDQYNGQHVLFLDDLKGESQMTFEELLCILDRYTGQIGCRYANVTALWTTVEVTSVYPPDEIYYNFVIRGERERNSYDQLKRRIDVLVYHYKDKDGNLAEHEMPMADYMGYSLLLDKFFDLLWVESDDYGRVVMSEESLACLEALFDDYVDKKEVSFSDDGVAKKEVSITEDTQSQEHSASED